MRILLIVHGYPPDGSGGTETYTHDLAVALAMSPDVRVSVLTREADPRRPDGAIRRAKVGPVDVVRINNTFQSCRSFEDTYRHPVLRAAAETVIGEIEPDIAHAHHLTCLSTDLLMTLKKRGVPVVLTLHDYWMLCHRGQLIDREYGRCDGPITGACARCIPPQVTLGSAVYRAAAFARRHPIAGALLSAASRLAHRASPPRSDEASASRLRHMREVIGACDRVLAPSATIRDRFAACGLLTGRVVPWTLGIGLRARPREPRRDGAPLRAGFVGAFLPTKAPHLLIEAAARLPPGSITVDLAGAPADYHGDVAYEKELAPWLAHAVVRRHGPVPHEEMPWFLSHLDVLVQPSVWLENSPLVIKEAFAAAIPAVVSDLGGMSELVRHEVDGLRFPVGDVAALARCLQRLVAERGLHQRLGSGIEAPLSIADDASRTLRLYRELIHRPEPRDVVPATVGAVIPNYRAPAQTVLAVLSLQASVVPPSTIVVVDNSHDGCAPALRGELDRSLREPVTVIPTERNLGFASGCNRGIEAALSRGVRHVLLMNSDAVLAPDTVALLLDAAAANPRAGILAPLIVSRSEPGTIESAGVSFDETTGRMRVLDAGEAVTAAGGAPVEVPAVTGCVMLIRREVIERIGYLDDAYFYSFEDLDFCLRARAAGFSVWCVPRARAYHEGGHAIGRRSARRVYFATRNHLRLAARVDPRSRRRALTAARVVGYNTAYVLTSPDAPLWSGLAAVLRGSWHHFVGRYGPDSAA
jgi:GT2 family glycosyltransferase/glycosyltransferase involved in cell wall biosynthesis